MKTIKLSTGQTTIVDDDDYLKFSKYKWGTISNKTHTYVARGTRKKGQRYRKILLHREILKAPKNKMVDHINQNTLDNRKENLRLANRANNLQNSKVRSDSQSVYKGVSKKISKIGTVSFVARIQISVNKRLFLGYFKQEIDAAKAYNEAAIKYFGKFAKLNKV